MTEILGAPQRETVKEKLVKCVLAPRRPPQHPPRDGSIDLAEDHSVPEGEPKSEQAPIRRPPYSNFARTCKVATKSGLFFWTVHGPFSFPQDGKENGGCIPAGQAPLAGARFPVAAFRRPASPPGGASLPPTSPEGDPLEKTAERPNASPPFGLSRTARRRS